jgi:hypothetical protein
MKIKILILVSLALSVCANAIDGLIALPGFETAQVTLGMTEAQLKAVRPAASEVLRAGNIVQIAESRAPGDTYFYEFRAGSLVCVTAARQRPAEAVQREQTAVLMQLLRTNYGEPTKAQFGRLNANAQPIRVEGAVFSYGGQQNPTGVLFESNELEWRISIFKNQLNPPVEIYVSFEQLSQAIPGGAQTPAPAIKDFVKELLP